MTTPTVLLNDPAQFVEAAAEQILTRLELLLAREPQVLLMLTGGSTPRAIYARVAESGTRLDWSRVRFAFGDERMVPPDHPDSNHRMAAESLLQPLSIPEAHVLRMEGERAPFEAAERYEEQLRRWSGGDTPRIHLLLLGMGDDGHCASLFPHTSVLTESERWVQSSWVPKLGVWRLTLTYPALNAAEQVLFLVNGAKKAPALAQVLQGERNLAEYPAQGIQPTTGSLTWLVDHLAAGQLWRDSAEL